MSRYGPVVRRLAVIPVACASVLLASSCSRWQQPAHQDLFSRETILAKMERVADWQLAHIAYEAPLPDGGTQPVTDTEWVRGAFFAGVMATFRATGNRAYLEAALALAEKNRWQPGPRPRHADDLCIAQTYAELYLLEPDPQRIRPTVERLDAILAQPRHRPGHAAV